MPASPSRDPEPASSSLLVVCTSNGEVGIREAMSMLQAGGSAVDAVEAGVRRVEANPDDHTVGLGGYPNLLGQVEVDAGIMDGRDLTAGAVGAVRRVLHAITLARKVMEHLPHVLLVGHGAERFAAEMGVACCELLTEEARRTWAEGLGPDAPLDQLSDVAHRPDAPDLWRWVNLAADPEWARGTVNFLARDGRGHLCAGTSTSGWAWKYPGRLGDSPIIGAGLYADDRHGAVACTGMGEMAIRAGTARSLIYHLAAGLPLDEAGCRVMADLNDLGGRYLSQLSVLAVDRTGHHAGWSTAADGRYLYMTGDMAGPQQAVRSHVPVETRWG